MQSSEVSIVTPTALYVQIYAAENQPARKQVRINRAEIAPEDLSTEMRALGRHIAKCRKKGCAVRIPAMRGSGWGQVLRALELKRAFKEEERCLNGSSPVVVQCSVILSLKILLRSLL